jgi:hypothetical protein
LLSASCAKAEAHHYFIKNKYDTFLITNTAQSVQKTGLWQNTTHISGYRFLLGARKKQAAISELNTLNL